MCSIDNRNRFLIHYYTLLYTISSHYYVCYYTVNQIVTTLVGETGRLPTGVRRTPLLVLPAGGHVGCELQWGGVAEDPVWYKHG